MKRLLAILLLLTPGAVHATVTANCVIDWDGMSRANVSGANLPNATHGTYHSWGTGSYNRWSVVSAPGNYAFPNPAVVSGATYYGASTNWLQNNTGYGGADEYLEFYLPGKTTPTVNKVVMAGFVQFNTTNTSGSAVYLDLLYFYTTSGGYAITQLQLDPSSGPINISAHSGSGNAGGPDVTRGKVYFMVNYQNGNSYSIKLYDPDNNFAYVDQTSITSYSANPYWIRWPSGYIGDPPGTIKFGPQILIYEPTSQQLIDLVTPSTTPPVIQTTNIFAWSTNTVGVPGGIPYRTTIYTNLYSSNATSAMIEAAINNCPSNQVVKLNAGLYNLTDPISIGTDDGVSLRGDGPSQTILAFASMTAPYFQTPGYTPSNFKTITVGYEQGSSNLTVSSTSGYVVGRLAHIAMNDSTNLVYTDSSSTSNMVQMSMIVATNSTQITIWPPLVINFSTMGGGNPTVGCLNGPALKAFGFENLQITNNSTAGNLNHDFVLMYSAYGCWFTNVEFSNMQDIGILLKRTARCEVRHSYFHGGTGTQAINAVMLYTFNSFNLIEDNIMADVMMGVELDSSTGNAILYNFTTNCAQPSFAYQVGALNAGHAAHCAFNLWEGNVANQWQNDGYHGSSSHATVFRNWLHGLHATYTGNRKMVDLGRYSYFNNIVGNVLGWTTWSNASGFAVAMSGEPDYTSQPVIYRLGYPNMGNNSLTPAVSITPAIAGYPDVRVTNTVLIHGNFDYKSGTQTWDSRVANTTLPDSYFYTVKPSSFGPMTTWPPFNPAAPASANQTNIPSGYRYVTGTDVNTPDTTAPTPSPMTWATNPAPASATMVSMTLSTATDTAAPVQYQIEVNGSTNTAWQASPSFTITGFGVATTNYFRGRAQDALGNATDWSSALGCTTFTQQVFNANGDFIVPTGVTNILVELWGGGGGAGASGTTRRPGGGGGAYARTNITVTPGTTNAVVVGAGGGPAVAGGNSTFMGARGSGGGAATTTAVGAAGSATTSIGAIKFAGGAGGARSTITVGGGGGGGGSGRYASAGSAGGAASGATGGTGGSGEGNGGAGGNANQNGVSGSAPGGGGGGQGGNTSHTSGSGAAGRVVISYGNPDTQDPAPDTEPPSMLVVEPTSSGFYQTPSASLGIVVQATDNTGVSGGMINISPSGDSIDLINISGALWSNSVPIAAGTNTITVTVTDAASNETNATLVVFGEYSRATVGTLRVTTGRFGAQ